MTMPKTRGWQMFDDMSLETKGLQDEQRRKLLDQAATVARCFATADGQACLDLLDKATLGRPMCRLGDGTAEAVALYAKFREGQNSIVAMIHNMIDVAAGQQPSDERGIA